MNSHKTQTKTRKFIEIFLIFIFVCIELFFNISLLRLFTPYYKRYNEAYLILNFVFTTFCWAKIMVMVKI